MIPFITVFAIIMVVTFVILPKTRALKAQVTLKPQLIPFLSEFNQSVITKVDSNTIKVFGNNYIELTIQVTATNMMVHITGKSPMDKQSIDKKLTLPLETSPKELLNKLDLALDEYMAEYRKVTNQPSISFIGLIREQHLHEELIDYSIDTIYILDEMIDNISRNDIEALKELPHEAETIAYNYKIITDYILNNKLPLTYVMPIDRDDKLIHLSTLETLELIYSLVNEIKHKKPEVANALSSISEAEFTSLYALTLKK